MLALCASSGKNCNKRTMSHSNRRVRWGGDAYLSLYSSRQWLGGLPLRQSVTGWTATQPISDWVDCHSTNQWLGGLPLRQSVTGWTATPPISDWVDCHSANQWLGELIGLYLRALESAILYFCHAWASYYIASSRLHQLQKANIISSFLSRQRQLHPVVLIFCHIKLSSGCV